MLKLLRKKIQSLSDTQVNILTAVLILVNVGIIIFWIHFWLSSPKLIPSEVKEPSLVEETSELFKPGKIGETEETLKREEKVIIPGSPNSPEVVLPMVIFNSSGQIKEIKENSLVITGDGSTFADLKPRELTLIYTSTTQTTSSDRTKTWKGLEGLKHLKVGQKIIFESPENIRGKTEFKVSYVNQL